VTSSSLPKLRSAALTFGAAALVAACGGAYRGGAGPAVAAATGPRGVEAAALPYTILDARTGRQLDPAEFWTKVAAARVVCVGEEHPNPHHHWAQLEVVSRLTPAGPYPQLALAMEMFQRPFQGVLDDYAAARIDEAALLSRAGWAERWGYDFAMYRPILARMLKVVGHLVALNPAKELVKRISRQGLESLTPAERDQLPELKLDDAAHRAWFDGVMAEMGGGHNPHASAPEESGAEEGEPASAAAPAGAPSSPHGAMPAMPSADRIYTVQVLWDESMADGAARWVKADPARRVVLIAGNGHCHDSAVVARIKRRGIAEVVSVRPVVDTGEDNVASALARPMNDYLFVMTMPKDPATH
jgi:uncharacterized iron-regulated protein